jgi:hypothetical protein
VKSIWGKKKACGVGKFLLQIIRQLLADIQIHQHHLRIDFAGLKTRVFCIVPTSTFHITSKNH